MSKHDGTAEFVESVIDQMIENDLDVGDAVAQVLDGEALPEAVEIEESALDKGDVTCPACGNEDLEYGVTETEDGELPTIYCAQCDTGMVAALDEGDGEVAEAEIDEDNPTCPECGSDKLEGAVIEEEGEELEVIVCEDCGTGYIPVGEEG